jgi:hypothetical protein
LRISSHLLRTSEAIANGQASKLEHRPLNICWQCPRLLEQVCGAICNGLCLHNVVGDAGHILASVALQSCTTKAEQQGAGYYLWKQYQ